MKHTFILIVILSLTISAVGQKTLPDDSGFTNKAEAKNCSVNDVKQGKWVEYMDTDYSIIPDSNAPFYILRIYKGGKPFGIGRAYYKDGNLNQRVQYVNGVKNGILIGYYESGKVMAELPYTADGKENGIEKEYYESGALESEIPYRDDKENGVQKDYYESGKLELEVPNSDDEENGIEKEYYESGALKSETPYKDDMANGVEKDYYEDGKIKSVTHLKDDEIESVKEYDENGKRIKK